MALDPAEQLTDGAYCNSVNHFQMVNSLSVWFRLQRSMSANVPLTFENGKSVSQTTLFTNQRLVGYSKVNKNAGLTVYLLFVISWFLHLGTRLPFLGLIRFDLILVCILSYLALSSKRDSGTRRTATDNLLRTLIAYSVLTIPFVEWPGSVIRTGIPDFIKGIVFYYFTIAFVRTEKDLKKFVFVFVACQSWRIFEPLYLHITEGYWGSRASMMAGTEFLTRLSGSPSDVVNPNGLAFIICTVLPFLYLIAGLSWKGRLAFTLFTPVCIYTLALTGSRSGMLGLVIVFLGILKKSKRRFLWALSGVLLVVLGFPLLSPDMQDRYLSIIGKGEKNAATAEGRLTGVEDNFVVALRRPIFGHGLGTSREANANFGTDDMPAHNLYAEMAQELGFVGLAIFILFLKSIFAGFAECKRAYDGQDVSAFLRRIVDTLQIFLIMNFLFSFASYGLNSYEWYLLGGLSVVMERLAVDNVAKVATSQGLKE
jgi:putative inorganic carbon (HCO3(-)) transporter